MKPTDQIVQLFDGAATRYQEKYMDVGHYHSTFDLFLSQLPKAKPKVLELGCGPGNVSRYLLDKRPDLQLLGTDLSPSMLELARANNPSAEFQSMDCRSVKDMAQEFDGIIGGFCLPYLSKEDAVQLIADAATRLNVGGVLYLSTMEDDYSRSGLVGPSDGGPAQMYTWYHEGDYLIRAMEKEGFKNIEVFRQDFPGAEEDSFQDLILIGTFPGPITVPACLLSPSE